MENKQFIARWKKVMQENGIKYTWLATQLKSVRPEGLTRGLISFWVNGRQPIPKARIIEIKKVLNMK